MKEINYTSAECFAGIGAWGKALDRVTKKHKDTHELKFYFEFDKYASNAFAAIHDVTEELNYWDITKQPDILPKVDILFYSPPCQTFSIAGNQQGTTVDKGNLFYQALEVIKKSKPKFAIMENVANLAQQFKMDFRDMLLALDDVGYINYNQVLNTKDYGIPQNRERIFIVSVRKDLYEQGFRYEWPKPIKLELKLKDILDEGVDQKYFLSEKMVARLMHKDNNFQGSFDVKDVNSHANYIDTAERSRRTNNFIKVKSATKKGYEEATEGDSINLEQPDSETRRGRVGVGVAQTLTTSCNQATMQVDGIYTQQSEKFIRGPLKGLSRTLKASQHDSGVVITTNNNMDIRKLLPIECFRLQGFDDEDYHKAVQAYDKKWQHGKSDRQMYIRAGNSITVNVIEEILENLLYERRQEVQMTLF